MKFVKFIVPTIACTAILASCNSGKSITDINERAEAIVKIVDATKAKLDTFGANLSISNLNADVTTTRIVDQYINSLTSNLNYSEKTRVVTTRTQINDGKFNVSGKVANLLSDYKDSPTITETKTKYIKGYAEGSGSATGKIGKLTATYSGTQSAESVSYTSSSYDFNYAADLLKAYFNKSVTNPDYDNFYFNLNDNKLNDSLDYMYNYFLSKSSGASDTYANLAKEIDSLRNYQYITKGLYRYGDLKERFTLQDVTNTSRDIIKTFDNIKWTTSGVAKTLTEIESYISKLKLSGNCFTVRENGGTYNFAVNLGVDDLNKIATYVNEILQPKTTNEDKEIDIVYIPNFTSGSISANIQTNSDNLITNVNLNFKDVTLDGKIDLAKIIAKIPSLANAKITILSTIETIEINKLNTDINLSLDYSVTESAINELIKPTLNDVWTSIYF